MDDMIEQAARAIRAFRDDLERLAAELSETEAGMRLLRGMPEADAKRHLVTNLQRTADVLGKLESKVGTVRAAFIALINRL